MEGLLLVDKPKGITSFDVIKILRQLTGVKKIGHGGTLDPLATGLLVVAIGKGATRTIDRHIKGEKVYEAAIEFGKRSDTYDAEGKVEKLEVPDTPTLGMVERALGKFEGEIMQTPPRFSAKKIGGKRAYMLAKEGEEFSLPAKAVTVSKINIVSYNWPILKLVLTVSSGTYIRGIANDLGEELGIGGMLVGLRRIASGPFEVKDALTLRDLSPMNIRSKLIKL